MSSVNVSNDSIYSDNYEAVFNLEISDVKVNCGLMH